MGDRQGGTRERTRKTGATRLMKGKGKEQKGVESNGGRKWSRKRTA